MAKDTSLWPDPTDKNDYEEETKPDVTIYPDTEEARRAYTIEPSRQKKEGATGQVCDEKKESQRVRKWEARTAWSSAYLCIEAKANPKFSPFVLPEESQPSDATEAQTSDAKPSTKERAKKVKKAASGVPLDSVQSASPLVLTTQPAEGPETHNPPAASMTHSLKDAAAEAPATGSPNPLRNPMPPFLRLDSYYGAQSMGQISRYAAKIMRRQFLAYCFTIFVCRKYAWLMRWDRAGLVISEPFDFIQQPQLLHQFFYRFACMTDVQRGCDLTAVPATEEEISRMRAFAGYDSGWHRAQFLGSLEEGQVMKILVPATDMITPEELKAGKKNEQAGSTSDSPREFLVGRPHFMSNSPTGSGTKGFIAYDVTDDRLVFLKDCWRPEAETYHPEGEVYLHLHSHNVQYIATPLGAGDVADSHGGIHTTRSNEFLDTPRWRHYRLILKEVAMPLEEYTTSYQLVDILYCAVRGSSAAIFPLSIWSDALSSARRSVGGGRVAPRCQRVQHHDISLQRSEGWSMETQGYSG